MKYERIREILNSCDNSRMRDVGIKEIECDDIDSDVLQFCNGKNVRCEKADRKDGAVFNLTVDGVRQRVSYTEIGG